MFQGDFIPVLHTPRLTLRGHAVEDFRQSASMWADPKVVAHISGAPSTEEQSWSRLLRYSGHWALLGYGYWVVTARDSGQFLGEVGFADFHRDTTPSIKGKPEAGWVFKSEAHGKGYATEAVGEMLRWADANLAFAKTACLFDPGYLASINVARKVGYANEVLGRYGQTETLFMERPRS